MFKIEHNFILKMIDRNPEQKTFTPAHIRDVKNSSMENELTNKTILDFVHSYTLLLSSFFVILIFELLVESSIHHNVPWRSINQCRRTENLWYVGLLCSKSKVGSKIVLFFYFSCYDQFFSQFHTLITEITLHDYNRYSFLKLWINDQNEISANKMIHTPGSFFRNKIFSGYHRFS